MRRALGRRCTGLIPAHAGKTLPHALRRRKEPAHPRSRGENWLAGESWALEAGSSPLTRGKQHRVMLHEEVPGLIPAHAGKTITSMEVEIKGGAHPRSRGENCAEAGISTSMRGSSPLTRGKPHLEPAGRDRRGLIPAHAGKTSAVCCATVSVEAHPRSRGENTS